MVEALKREVYEEIVGGGPAGNTAGTLLANRDANAIHDLNAVNVALKSV
jgi:thioredoxin reductase